MIIRYIAPFFKLFLILLLFYAGFFGIMSLVGSDGFELKTIVIKALQLSAILFLLHLVFSRFSVPNPEIFAQVSDDMYRHFVQHPVLYLNGKLIAFGREGNAYVGISPFNFLTNYSKITIQFSEVKNGLHTARIRAKSTYLLQVLDFGYNTRLVSSFKTLLENTPR